MLIRRPKFEAVLYRLLIDSSANSIQTIQGTVTGLVPSDDMSDIRSVNIRTNEGEEKTVKDVALVIGQPWYSILCAIYLNPTHRLHR